MYQTLLGLSKEDYEHLIVARVMYGLAESEEEAIRYYFNKGIETITQEYEDLVDKSL